MLLIRGEKQEERKEEDRDYHLMERSLGTFSRALRLPFPVDPAQVLKLCNGGKRRHKESLTRSSNSPATFRTDVAGDLS